MAPYDAGTSTATIDPPAYVRYYSGTSQTTRTLPAVWIDSTPIVWSMPAPLVPKNWRWFHCYDRRPAPQVELPHPIVRRVEHAVQERRCPLDRSRNRRKAWLASLS